MSAIARRWIRSKIARSTPLVVREDLRAYEAQRRLLACVRPENPMTFREFVAVVRPTYQWYRHCEVLGDVLERVASGEIKRLMIFMPPRHGKSEETSRLFSAYFLYRFPDFWVAITSYAADLAYTLSGAAKDHYVNAGGTLKKGAKAVKHWETGKGGGFWAAGVGGPATGKGWHLGIIDDPVKNSQEASSVTIRERNKEWFNSVFYTREEPWSATDANGALIVIQTRWHEDDLAGWLLAEEEATAAELAKERADGVPEDEIEDNAERWHIVCLPAIAEKLPKFPDTCTVEPDWRKEGEALCPERRPLRKLQRILHKIKEYFFGALFQQRPRPKDGDAFRAAWFDENLVDASAVPADAEYVRFWDKAGSGKKTACYTAGVLIARCRRTNRFFVVDVVRGRWDSGDREDKMLATAVSDQLRYGIGVRIWMEQEPGSGGLDSARASVQNLVGFNAQFETATGEKPIRFEPFAAQAKIGNVKFVRSAGTDNHWNPAYRDELIALWNGHYCDQADATAGAFNKLAIPDPDEPAGFSINRAVASIRRASRPSR